MEAGLLFAGGLSTFVAVIGPSGWGKTHLVEAIGNRLADERGPRSYEVWSAEEWVVASRNRTSSSVLLLDNVQDALVRSRSRQQLRVALERRVKAGWPTLLSFTESRCTRPIRNAMPSPREWNVAVIRAPDGAEREVIIDQMARAEGITMGVELTRILAHRMDGNGRTLIGALKRLRLNGPTWTSSAEVLRACGILNPFFAGNSAWDLRDHISEIAQIKQEIRSTSPSECAIYAMLKVAQLGEADVARYFEIGPARAYTVSQRVDERVKSDPAVRTEVSAFVDRVVATLISN